MLLRQAVCAVVGAAGIFFVGGCGSEEAPPAAQQQARVTPVAVAAAVRQDVPVMRRAVGSIQAVNAIDVTAEVPGFIAAINFEEGQRVRKGDVLIQLDQDQAEAELAAATARRDRIRSEFQSIQQLQQRGAATEKEFQDIRTELQEAEANARVAEIALADHTILAPFDGQVGLRQQSLGSYVQPGDPLTTLASVDPIEVAFELPEQDLGKLAAGLPVTVQPAAFGDRRFAGDVTAVDARVDPATRTVRVMGRLDNADGVLKPGMFVNVNLTVETRRDAVVVPETAVLQRGAAAVVYIVQDGKAAERAVVLGQRRAGLVEVREGLDSGAVVITSDQGQVRNGAAVQASPDRTLASLGIDPAPFVSGLPEAVQAGVEAPKGAVAQ